MSEVRKQLPPFARRLVQLRKRGLAPIGGVIISADWTLARSHAWRVVVPPELDPLSLDFFYVAGLEVLLLAHTQARLDLLAQAVAPYRPIRLIGACREPRPRITAYIKA